MHSIEPNTPSIRNFVCFYGLSVIYDIFFSFGSCSFVLFNLISMWWLLVLCPTRLHTHASIEYTLSCVLMVMNSGLRFTLSKIHLFTFLSTAQRTHILTIYVRIAWLKHTHKLKQIQTKSLFFLVKTSHAMSFYVDTFCMRLHDVQKQSRLRIYFASNKFYDNSACDCSFNIVYFICTL